MIGHGSCSFSAMGTLVCATWEPAGNVEEIQRLIRQRVRELENRLSIFKQTSQVVALSRILNAGSEDILEKFRSSFLHSSKNYNVEVGLENHDAGAELLFRLEDILQANRFSSDLARVMEASVKFANLTQGAFYPFLGRQMHDWKKMVAERANRECELGDSIIDFGGIAKGYAADQVRDLVVSKGGKNVVVSFGSSSISIAGDPVCVGLQSPWEGLEEFGHLLLTHPALSVSADTATRIGSGNRVSHVLDPSTGKPAFTDLASVLVCAADGMECEAWATAFLVLGLERAMDLDAAQQHIDTVFFTVDGRVLASPNLQITAHPGVQQWLDAQRVRTQ